MRMIAASLLRSAATTRLSIIRTPQDRANPHQSSVRNAMLAAVPSLRAFAISLSRNEGPLAGLARRASPTRSYAERLIGSIRRDCLDHVVVFGEQHLRHLLNSYQKYYNEVRTHLSLQKDAPIPRDARRVGRVLSLPILSGVLKIIPNTTYRCNIRNVRWD